jgi:hypothetical protein
MTTGLRDWIRRAIADALSRLPNWHCVFQGHDGRIERDGARLYLRCTRCDRVSPGIVL